MEAFATNFSLTLLHSLWQSALLLMVYLLINSFNQVRPSAKRNMLFGMLLIQLVVSIISYGILSSALPNHWLEIYTLPYRKSISPFINNFSVYLIISYTTVVLFKVASHIFHYKRFIEFQRQQFIKPDVEIRIFTQLKAAALGVKKVQVWLSENIETPFTYGFLKPCIILPVALINQLSITETEALIVHELTHIRNKDYLLNYAVLFMETVFCFNPFIFQITRKIKLEREKTCDLQVIDLSYSPVVYAETLLKTALHRRNKYVWQIGAISKTNHLLNRIQFFTLETNFSKMKTTFNPINYALMLFIAFISIFILADDTNSASADSKNTATFLMPSYSYHFPVNVEETNRINPTSAIAVVQPETPVATITSAEKIISEPVSEIMEQPIQAMHVNAAPEISKQVIITEQSPATGKITTYVFKSTFVNGRWTAEPVVSVIETKSDSCDQNTPVEVKEFNQEQ